MFTLGLVLWTLSCSFRCFYFQAGQANGNAPPPKRAQICHRYYMYVYSPIKATEHSRQKDRQRETNSQTDRQTFGLEPTIMLRPGNCPCSGYIGQCIWRCGYCLRVGRPVALRIAALLVRIIA